MPSLRFDENVFILTVRWVDFCFLRNDLRWKQSPTIRVSFFSFEGKSSKAPRLRFSNLWSSTGDVSFHWLFDRQTRQSSNSTFVETKKKTRFFFLQIPWEKVRNELINEKGLSAESADRIWSYVQLQGFDQWKKNETKIVFLSGLRKRRTDRSTWERWEPLQGKFGDRSVGTTENFTSFLRQLRNSRQSKFRFEMREFSSQNCSDRSDWSIFNQPDLFSNRHISESKSRLILQREFDFRCSSKNREKPSRVSQLCFIWFLR